MEPGQHVTSQDERDDPAAVYVVLEAGINHASGTVARIAVTGRDDLPAAERWAIYRLERNLREVS